MHHLTQQINGESISLFFVQLYCFIIKTWMTLSLLNA
jgi:hypothetical protein